MYVVDLNPCILETTKWVHCTLTNSEDPDEMPHNYAAFHLGLHCKGKNNPQGQKYVLIGIDDL